MTWGNSHWGAVQLQPNSRLPGRHSKAHCSHKNGENMTWIGPLFFLHIMTHMCPLVAPYYMSTILIPNMFQLLAPSMCTILTLYRFTIMTPYMCPILTPYTCSLFASYMWIIKIIGSICGLVSSGRELVLSYILFGKKFGNLLWPNVKSNPCFFNCLWEIFLASLLGKKSRSLWHHYTTLHFTELYPCANFASEVLCSAIAHSVVCVV